VNDGRVLNLFIWQFCIIFKGFVTYDEKQLIPWSTVRL